MRKDQIKTLFLQDNVINESLALCDLAGLLKQQGYQYDLLVEREEKLFYEKIATYNPSIIIIPISILSPGWGLVLAEKLKVLVKGTLIVAAGSYSAFFPEIIEKTGIDIVLRGEAELGILSLLNCLELNKDYSKIKNLWVKINGQIFKNNLAEVSPLNELPLPDRELYYKYKSIRAFPIRLIASGRGCPNSCAYCFNEAFRKKIPNPNRYTRKKSVTQIMEEISFLQSKKYPISHIHFSDDLFTYDRRWVLDFCDKYKKRFKIQFTINSKIEYLDKEMLAHLKLAGCRGIAIGIESGNEALRCNIMNKNTKTKNIIERCKEIKAVGLVLTTFNMMNLPYETIENVYETIKLNQLIKSDNPRVNILGTIPHTAMHDMAIKNDLLLVNSEEEYKKIGIIKNPNIKKIMVLYYLFPLLVSLPFLFRIIEQNRWILGCRAMDPFWKIVNFFKLLFEKKFISIGFLSGLRYFFHTGGPKNRTTVYSTLL